MKKNRRSKIGRLRAALLELLGEHERDDALPTSARFLFYELVQRGILSKERKTQGRRPDQNMSDALTDLRENGDVERETGELAWERLALTQEQVIRYALPVIEKRDRRYRDGRPHLAVETEALSQTIIVEIVRNRLEQLLPEPLATVQIRAAAQRAVIKRALQRLR